MRSRSSKIALLLAATLTVGSLATSGDAQARRWHGGWHNHHFHHGGWRGGWARWAGPAFVGGLALAAAPAYYYGAPYYAYGGCHVERRVRFTPWGKVVRRVRVC